MMAELTDKFCQYLGRLGQKKHKKRLAGRVGLAEFSIHFQMHYVNE